MAPIYQHPISIITPVDPSKLEYLRTLLNSIQNPDVENNRIIPFTNLPSVHFIRFVIIENETGIFPIQLAFSCDIDGSERTFLNELIREAHAGLDQIYGCCIGYQGDLKRYWRKYKTNTTAFYNGHVGISTRQIRQEDELRKNITNYVDEAYRNGIINNKSAAEIKQMVGTYIAKDPSFTWALLDKGVSPMQKFALQYKSLTFNLVILIAILILLGFSTGKIFKLLRIPRTLGYLALFAGVGLTLLAIKRKLNKLEKQDGVDTISPSPTHVNVLTQAENFRVQNQLTHLVEIKPGQFRLNTLKFVLITINFLAKTIFNKGELGTIPSIHFARWIIIDNNKRLLFFSNFDGSWENYLGDFVDKAALGLTAVWSNTKGFPRTHNLVNEGARDEQSFKEWTRRLQISTQVWYSAYKTLSVQNINNNTLIRSGLFQIMDEANSQAWLDRIFYYKKQA